MTTPADAPTTDATILHADEAPWRPSNQQRVDNLDLARTLGCEQLGARYWRLAPGQASTLHRHVTSEELYVLITGAGRMRLGEAADAPVHTLRPGSAVRVAPDVPRHLFNDTDTTQLWLVVGAPVEAANTLEMTEEQLARLYPRGPKALPAELDVQAGPASESQWVQAIDHVVLRTDDVERLCGWYERVLGMRRVTSPAGRTSLALGGQQLRVHGPDTDAEPVAGMPTPGALDICLLTHRTMAELVAHLEAIGEPIEAGPVTRSGATGPLESAYLRDPDGNLV